jgi:hypothetical protein
VTVAAALRSAGVAVAAEPDADLHAVVIAEALKPEDRAMLAARPNESLLIVNKADLSGFGAGGPVARAQRRAAEYRASTGVPTVAMIGLLAIARMDDELVAALRVLVDTPADMSSADAFVTGDHRLSSEVRRRLLDTLDRFGIAHAVLAVADNAGRLDAAALTARMRELSLVDRVAAHLDALGAPVRYRRLRSAVIELSALAAQFGDDELSSLLAGDDAVLALMTAAVDVVEANGMTVDRGDDRAAHLRRAVQWRRYGAGPVDRLHSRCAADICRGSLRLWARST